MPSYTIRYLHPVSKVTWHPVDDGIRITISAVAADEISPPKSPDLSARGQENETPPPTDQDSDYSDSDYSKEWRPRTPSAISLVVHPSGLGLDRYRNTHRHRERRAASSPVTKTAELVLPDPQLQFLASLSGENTETDSVTVLTPSSYTARTTTIGGTMYASARGPIQPNGNGVHTESGRGNRNEQEEKEGCECLSRDKLSTLQDVLAEERKNRPTLEERVKMPLVSVPRTVRTGKAIARFNLAFPELAVPSPMAAANKDSKINNMTENGGVDGGRKFEGS